MLTSIPTPVTFNSFSLSRQSSYNSLPRQSSCSTLPRQSSSPVVSGRNPVSPSVQSHFHVPMTLSLQSDCRPSPSVSHQASFANGVLGRPAAPFRFCSSTDLRPSKTYAGAAPIETTGPTRANASPSLYHTVAATTTASCAALPIEYASSSHAAEIELYRQSISDAQEALTCADQRLVGVGDGILALNAQVSRLSKELIQFKDDMRKRLNAKLDRDTVTDGIKKSNEQIHRKLDELKDMFAPTTATAYVPEKRSLETRIYEKEIKAQYVPETHSFETRTYEKETTAQYVPETHSLETRTYVPENRSLETRAYEKETESSATISPAAISPELPSTTPPNLRSGSSSPSPPPRDSPSTPPSPTPLSHDAPTVLPTSPPPDHPPHQGDSVTAFAGDTTSKTCLPAASTWIALQEPPMEPPMEFHHDSGATNGTRYTIEQLLEKRDKLICSFVNSR